MIWIALLGITFGFLTGASWIISHREKRGKYFLPAWAYWVMFGADVLILLFAVCFAWEVIVMIWNVTHI